MMKVTLDHISCRDGVPILRAGAGTRAAMELSIHNRGLFLACCLAVEVRIHENTTLASAIHRFV